MTPPDASSIDWTGISLWATGIAGVLSSTGAAVWLGVRRALKIAQSLPTPPAAIHRTNVYTTDGLALDRLTAAVEAGNQLMVEGNALRREATDERRTLRAALDDNTEVTEKSVTQVAELRDEVKDLGKEIVRLQSQLSGRRA